MPTSAFRSKILATLGYMYSLKLVFWVGLTGVL